MPSEGHQILPEGDRVIDPVMHATSISLIQLVLSFRTGCPLF